MSHFFKQNLKILRINRGCSCAEFGRNWLCHSREADVYNNNDNRYGNATDKFQSEKLTGPLAQVS